MTEAQGCRRIQRDADHAIKDAAILVPAYAGSGVIAGDEDVRDLVQRVMEALDPKLIVRTGWETAHRAPVWVDPDAMRAVRVSMRSMAASLSVSFTEPQSWRRA